MKVKIESEEGLPEDEVIIRCARLDDSIVSLQNYILKQSNGKRCLPLKIDETEFYVPLEEIYFFETEGRELRVHTAEKFFYCSYKLYELEELLPGNFMRVSKSTIANLDFIYSVTRNLTASSVLEFSGTNKRVMLSRAYFKVVTERLKARKLGL